MADPRRVLAAVVTIAVCCLWGAPPTGALSPGRVQFGQAVYATTQEFGVAVVVVQRHLGADGRAAVSVSTRLPGGGNAVPGRDFVPLLNQSLLWQDGDDRDKELYVRVLNDRVPQEADKTFTLYLHDASGAAINPERGTTQVSLVAPSNLQAGSFRFLNASLVANESATSVFEVPVLWEGGTTSKGRVAYEIVCGSACTPADVTPAGPPVLEWRRGGPAVQSIRLNVLDDGVYEQTEFFRVRLLPPSELPAPAVVTADDPSSAFTLPPATLGFPREVVVSIRGPNNVRGGVVQLEAPCFPACRSRVYQVMDGGVVRAFLQRRDGRDGVASARVQTVSDTALAGVDFVPLDQLVTWGDGDASDKSVVIETRRGVERLAPVVFHVVLRDVQGAAPPPDHVRSAVITIAGPSNVIDSEVNFVVPPSLGRVLRFPNVPFLPLATRLDSGIRACPRHVVRAPGRLELHVARLFGSPLAVAQPASATLRLVEETAREGLDFAALTVNDSVVSWATGDRSTKKVGLNILEPATYSTETRSLVVQVESVAGELTLGVCHHIQVVLEAVSKAPRITGFDLNMNLGTLTLRVSVPVRTQSLAVSKIMLQNARATERVRLSPATTTASPDGTTILLTLGTADLNALKAATSVAKSSATTLLSVDAGLFDYVVESCTAAGLVACAHAPFGAIQASAPLAVTTFTPDTTRPRVLGFSMDLSQRLVKLRFSEPVSADNVQIEALAFSDTATAIQLYPLSAASSRVYRPTPNPRSGVRGDDANPLPSDQTYLTIELGKDDVAELQRIGNGMIGVQAASTFLSVGSSFTRDLAEPANPLVAIELVTPGVPALLGVTPTDCSPCPAGTFVSSSCSDMKSRVCSPCTVCPTNSFAIASCTPVQDTICYPCRECPGGMYASSACTATSDRVCSSCTRCTSDEYEASPCAQGVNRVCRTCDSCTLTAAQIAACEGSKRWKRRVMKAPYGCPPADARFQTYEARLQRAKSNRCGAGMCSCSGKGVGNANPNGDSFPDDPRCVIRQTYGIDL
ncbi:hypothetical protein P43SY_000945 [Pythium insidiosum]|uniref:TNFR-Cys domain-containing protein n=1 Tax=Pythium insidiosum TaxID=114742 RepID=A0AAD5M5G2_PYTIN|nr:hypothetical protein P43SY_000945 [Pythium insidiosum]